MKKTIKLFFTELMQQPKFIDKLDFIGTFLFVHNSWKKELT